MPGFFILILILIAFIVGMKEVGGALRSRSDVRVQPGMDPQRLDRIESALSGLERRLDEMHEQQQFLERLLAERPDPRRLRRGQPESDPDPAVDSILFDTDRGADRDPDRGTG